MVIILAVNSMTNKFYVIMASIMLVRFHHYYGELTNPVYSHINKNLDYFNGKHRIKGSKFLLVHTNLSLCFVL